jgi:hypothetical protein
MTGRGGLVCIQVGCVRLTALFLRVVYHRDSELQRQDNLMRLARFAIWVREKFGHNRPHRLVLETQ